MTKKNIPQNKPLASEPAIPRYAGYSHAFKHSSSQPKNKLWERELLDFSERNALLSFQGKGAIAFSTKMKRLLEDLERGRELPLRSIQGEEKKGEALYSPMPEKELNASAAKLRRRSREAFEETGARILFLACGFLSYGRRGEELRRAPILLLPAELVRARGGADYALSVTGEPFVNSTLLEFLKQEYRIDLRELSEGGYPAEEILSAFYKEAERTKGWQVTEEVFLSVFCFQRFFMWNDLREHIGEFSRNRNVQALLTGSRRQQSEEGESACVRLRLPLPSDSSQRRAISLYKSGKSFVLSGPPGTGKSQTIANLIALALGEGKSVLFVAEKKAAIDVVARRLKEIGLDDFCLNTGGGREEIFAKLTRTLSLAPPREENLELCRGEYEETEEELNAFSLALNKKRALGLSVYEAITGYLERREEPTLFGMSGAFYAMLSEEKLKECKELVFLLSSAAKECGGVLNTPFENVNLKEYSSGKRDEILLSARMLSIEIGYLRRSLSLFSAFFGAEIPRFTEEKLTALKTLLARLSAGVPWLDGVTAEEFLSFSAANLRLETALGYYARHFRVLIHVDREREELEKFVASGGDYRLDKTALFVMRRLERVALHPLSDEDAVKYINTLLTVFSARKEIAKSKLGKHFVDRAGHISERKRQEFLSPVKELSALASSLFHPWNPEAFFSACIRAQGGHADSLLGGVLRAVSGFERAREEYLSCTAGERSSSAGEDLLDYYSVKAAALLDNLDLLPGRCAYKAAEEKLKEAGMKFVSDALEQGKITPENALRSFEKSVFSYFLSLHLTSDPALLRMTAENVESLEEKLCLLGKRQLSDTRAEILKTLLQRLPREGELSEERALFYRLLKTKPRGALRTLFLRAPALMQRLCPCLFLSPDAAAQYLAPRADSYDLVIFDEASQMTTSEAIPALARARQAVIAGDSNQLPPTSFFRTAFSREEETELTESVLDEALASGFEERCLLWHYRSRHESLVAFSNAMYYGNRLNTFPSPDALTRVHLKRVEGIYERGAGKRNSGEAAALTEEVVKRLSDPVLSRYSMGIVTFSEAQREEIESQLNKELAKRRLEEAAFGGAEPLFIKNLENVQGDERDVILFSVCYGFDGEGRLSYNFGPLNRAGGWRRLNVACSRAREEMLVFSGLRAEDIDIERTSSRGVAGLKAFLEFAEKGRAAFPPPAEKKEREGMGKYLARELEKCGYECRVNVGAGAFKLDVAIVDPKDKSKYILGILVKGGRGDAADSAALLPEMLRLQNWKLLSLCPVSYFNNPERELKRIKEKLDELTGREKLSFARYERPYRFLAGRGGETSAFLADEKNAPKIKERLAGILRCEQPISRAYLKKRCLESYGIVNGGARAEAILDRLLSECRFPSERVGSQEYFFRSARVLKPQKFRAEKGELRRRQPEDFTPFDTAVLIKGILEEKVALYDDELTALVASVYGIRQSAALQSFIEETVVYGQEKGMFSRSLSGRISLS